MKKITLACCTAAMLLFACNNNSDEAKSKTDSTASKGETEVKKDAPPMTMPDSATMMKNWQMCMTQAICKK